MSNETPVYDLKALSDKLNIGIRTLREYVKAGKLKAKKIGVDQVIKGLEIF